MPSPPTANPGITRGPRLVFPRCPRRHGVVGRAGLTLVEVMMGMVVIGTACFTALSGMLMSLRIADSNLLALCADSTVRSVSEQLLALDYVTLFNDQLPVDVASNPGGSLTAGIWNARSEDLHHTPQNSRDDLQLRINPTVTRVRESGGLDYAQVVIDYEWLDSSFFVPRTRSDTVTMLVAPISAF